MGRVIPVRMRDFTLHGIPTKETERRETRLAQLFLPNMMLRFGQLRCLLTFQVADFFLFFNVDSRSERKEVSNLLRRASHK
jgi:hypothetical protein